MEISKKSLAVILTESLAANLSGAAFVKMTDVTNTSMKTDDLQVKLSEILDKSAEQHCI